MLQEKSEESHVLAGEADHWAGEEDVLAGGTRHIFAIFPSIRGWDGGEDRILLVVEGRKQAGRKKMLGSGGRVRCADCADKSFH